MGKQIHEGKGSLAGMEKQKSRVGCQAWHGPPCLQPQQSLENEGRDSNRVKVILSYTSEIKAGVELQEPITWEIKDRDGLSFRLNTRCRHHKILTNSITIGQSKELLKGMGGSKGVFL